MTRGLGLRIGTTHTVAATAPDEHTTESVLMRRSTLTFGPDSTVRLGDPPDGNTVLSEFVDRIGDVLVAGDGHHYTGQDLVAVAAHCVIAETGVADDTPIVLVHPAVYTTDAVGELRAALDRAGLARVGLVPEPVAALAWFEAEHGPLADGFALVCTLGADGLDLTIVAGSATGGADPIVGRPLCSLEVGDHSCGPARDDLLALVAASVDTAGLHPSDLGLVLLTGAEAPVGLRERLERLGASVICPPHPGSASAQGAALLAAASRFPGAPPREAVRRRRGYHLGVAAAVIVAAALTVPWYATNTESNLRHDDPAAASRPLSQHGFRLVERAAPAHIPSASSATIPPVVTTIVHEPNPVMSTPRIVAITAQPIQPARQIPVDQIIEFPVELDTTTELSTPKPRSPSPIPFPATAPSPEPTPTPATGPDETTPTAPPPTTLPDEPETSPPPADPSTPSDPDTTSDPDTPTLSHTDVHSRPRCGPQHG
ncbi:hypothetical protein [Rhodococcus opacus]|uniref:hypothetical protein n=1 Tax=Rhodococcus opacus TaxID=37919 RepID=UPI0006BB5313|nr:hypothetical protein [Rhodococcus opacus]